MQRNCAEKKRKKKLFACGFIYLMWLKAGEVNDEWTQPLMIQVLYSFFFLLLLKNAELYILLVIEA